MMADEQDRLNRVRRLHRVQSTLAEREEMRRSALEASRLSLLAREVETVGRFAGDATLADGAAGLVRRLANLSVQRRQVEEEAARQKPRLIREKAREAITARRLALLDAAAADRARRAEIIDIVEARLGRLIASRKHGETTWRST
jgi:hypothetical protein